MYEWTPRMGLAAPNRVLEPLYRAAISAATAHLEQVVESGADLPDFSGGMFASPKNSTAVAMAVAIDAAIAEVAPAIAPSGALRLAIHTVAVFGAYRVRAKGFGEEAWKAFVATLPQRPPPTKAEMGLAAALRDVAVFATAGAETPFAELDDSRIAARAQHHFVGYLGLRGIGVDDERLFDLQQLATLLGDCADDLAPPPEAPSPPSPADA